MATKSKKPVTKKPTSLAAKAKTDKATVKRFASGSRRLKRAEFRAFRYRRRTKRTVVLPNAFKITARATKLLWAHRGTFLGIVVVYALLNIILVRGFSSSTDVGSLRGALDQAFTGHFAQLASGLTVFTVLLSSSGSVSSTGGVYQLILSLIVSLAVIWALRSTVAKERFRIRDAFYRGMYPLIPFILVLMVVLLQFVPLLVGGTLYSIVTNNGIAATGLEVVLWLLLFVFLAGLSFYMLCSSIFALYIVTLPDMTPMKALRSARELVRYRRFPILRKLLFLPLLMLVIAAVLVVPVIIVAAPVAQWLFFFLTMLALVALHAYMYILYRELLV